MDGSQTNSHKKQNKHMEIWFAGNSIRYDPAAGSYCG